MVMGSFFRREHSKRIEDLRTAVIFFAYAALASAGQLLLIRHRIFTIDSSLLSCDRLLAFPTLNIWHWTTAHPFVFYACGTIYVLLPTVLAITWIVEQDAIMRLACVIAGVLCFVGFWLLPAVGPYHYDWIRHTPFPLAQRNCLPSMHMTWALLLAMIARDRRLKIALWVYAGLIAVATIGVGEHYLIDLIAAVPFSLLVLHLCRWWQCYSSHSSVQITSTACGAVQTTPKRPPPLTTISPGRGMGTTTPV